MNTLIGGAMAALRGPVSTPGEVWARASAELRQELGENTFGSWLAQASVCEARGGGTALVAPTGFARDWIRKNAWRRVSELWAAHDPLKRPLELKCRADFDAEAPATAAAQPAPSVPELVVAPASSDTRRSSRAAGLQERFTFDSFVAGP